MGKKVFDYLIKVKYDFIQQSNAFHAVVHLFRIETRKVRYGSKQYAHTRVGLGIQLLFK